MHVQLFKRNKMAILSMLSFHFVFFVCYLDPFVCQAVFLVSLFKRLCISSSCLERHLSWEDNFQLRTFKEYLLFQFCTKYSNT